MYVLLFRRNENIPFLFAIIFDGHLKERNDFETFVEFANEGEINTRTKSNDKSHEKWALVENLQLTT